MLLIWKIDSTHFFFTITFKKQDLLNVRFRNHCLYILLPFLTSFRNLITRIKEWNLINKSQVRNALNRGYRTISLSSCMRLKYWTLPVLLKLYQGLEMKFKVLMKCHDKAETNYKKGRL